MANSENISEIVGTIKDIMIDVFDLDDLDVNELTSADDIEGWDSLSHLRLVTQVEVHYGIRFSTAEVASFTNVGDMARTIVGKLNGRA